MLLRFGVANYLSMKNQQEISLVASSLHDNEEGLLRAAPSEAQNLLPAVVIYGANASGKSNFTDALQYMRSAVLYSHRRGDPAGGTRRRPFLLDNASLKTPTKLDIDFLVGGTRYHYGFEADDTSFTSEWLYAFPSERRQTLFVRKHQTFEFGRSLKGRNKIIEDLTRPNSLFVSAATQNGHEQLSVISNFFQSIRVLNNLATLEPGSATDELDERVMSLLVALGTGVVSYRKKEIEVPVKAAEFARELVAAMKKIVPNISSLEKELANRKIFAAEFGHQAKDGSIIFLEFNNESAGTQRLISMLTAVFHALDEGSLIVIDELNASLHTQACETIVGLFSSPRSNPKGAQLIATTHDTNLLNSQFLRRDQVWFTEKGNGGATNLFPLTDIYTRKGDNIEKGYLQGRFGAIPFSGSVSELLSGE